MTSICAHVTELREHVLAWRAEAKRVALVPTMGALHAGHMALIAAAKEAAERVVVTIFVNPKQFGPTEDFSTYPRDLDADRAQIDAAGADLIFAPGLAAMYPEGFATTVAVAGPAAAGLEDRFRPTHFAGVATIVLKLLLQAQPDVAVFGEKDFQQLKMIEHMVRDLAVPVEILGVPIVREADGLALSSRNVYLTAEERSKAPKLHLALLQCADAIGRGTEAETAVEQARRAIEAAGFVVDYVEARCVRDLALPHGADRGEGRVLTAARLGPTRLIDNVAIEQRATLVSLRGLSSTRSW